MSSRKILGPGLELSVNWVACKEPELACRVEGLGFGS